MNKITKILNNNYKKKCKRNKIKISIKRFITETNKVRRYQTK